MENFAAVVVAFITGVIGPIAILYIKHKLDSRKKKPDMVMYTLRVSELVNQKIDHIKEEFKADEKRKFNQKINRTNALATARNSLINLFLKEIIQKTLIAYDNIVFNTREIIRL